MSASDNTPDATMELLSASLDGQLTDEQRSQLVVLLKSDPSFRQKYVDYLLLDSLLQEELCAETLVGIVDMLGQTTTADIEASRGTPSKPARLVLRILRPALWLTACAAAVGLAILFQHFYFREPLPSPNPLQPESAAPFAHVVEFDGQVELLTPAGEIREVRIGEKIHPGQSLRTVGEGSFALVKYDSATSFEMNSGTQVRLVNDDKGAAGSKIFLSQGILRTETRGDSAQPSLVVATSFAEIQGKNAKFICSSTPDATWIEVEKGPVGVVRQSDGRPMLVEAGFKASFSLDQQLPPAVAVPVSVRRPEFEFVRPASKAIAFTAGGDKIVLSSRGKIWQYSFAERKEKLVLEEKTLDSDLAFLSLDSRLLACVVAGEIQLRDMRDCKPLPSIGFPIKSLRGFALAPDGKRVAMIQQPGQNERWVRVWSTATRTEEFNLPVPLPHFGTLAFSRDGRFLAGGTSRGEVVLWDLEGPHEIARWDSLSGSVDVLAFSPDRQLLAVSVGNQVVFWDLKSKLEMKRLIEPGFVFRSLTFSPDGKTFAAGSASGDLRIWQVATWRELVGFKADNRSIANLAFSPDGLRIAAVNSRSIRVWRMPEESLEE